MKTVFGNVNSRWLADILTLAHPRCTAIQAAVAYADPYPPFVEFLSNHSIPLKFYGRIDPTATGGFERLRWFLSEAPAEVEAYVVEGQYHPKVIWCHGYGAYVGSASLPRNTSDRSIECGVFLDEEELRAQELAEALETLFLEIDRTAQRLSQRLIDKLAAIDVERRRVALQVNSIERKYKDLIRARKPHSNQPHVAQHGQIPAKPK
jgi:phosphatidylserine/phosphatidylglycerophosphate/cardiolipin synthase-like enzyme